MTDIMLEKRRLGRTDMQVTPLGLGGAWLGYTPNGFSDELAVATVLRALELGINLIDTSPLYSRGESERRIGMALEEWYSRGGKREDIILSTKAGTRGFPGCPKDYSAEATKRSVQKSLALLRTDYIDVVHVHDPDNLTPVLAPGGALEGLRELRENGIIRAIGLGVRSHEFHIRCIETGEFDVSLIYRDYNLLYQSGREVLDVAAAHDVGVLNGMAIIKGLLGGQDPLELAREEASAADTRSRSPYYQDPAEVERARVLWKWARSRDISLLDLNLQYCLRERRISSTLVGASNPDEIEKDVRAVSEPIKQDTWREFRAGFRI